MGFPTSPALLLVAFTAFLLCVALAVHGAGADRRRAVGRMSAIAVRAAGARAHHPAGGLPGSGSGSIAQRVIKRLQLLDSKEAVHGRRLLSRAGLRGEGALAVHLLLRILMPALFGIAFLLEGKFLHIVPIAPQLTWPAACAATLAGFYTPVLMLNNRIARRQAELKRSLPDGIDLLVILVESGASINEAFARVGRELVRGHAALADEFSITAAELAFLPVRRTAFENLLERTDVPGIRGIVTTMLQSERFGTPIAQALRVLAAEFRNARMMAAAEKAAKLPVLLTVPMMIFILPVLFIVLLGPAALTILDAMAQ